MNIFTCTCRLGKDPEQRFTTGGDSAVQFDAAVDSGFGDKKTTTWIRFVMWGKRGASCTNEAAAANPPTPMDRDSPRFDAQCAQLEMSFALLQRVRCEHEARKAHNQELEDARI